MRLRRIEDESGDDVRIATRSFLLRPRPEPGRTLERFREYTRSWLRPASNPDAPPFRVWSTDAGPPSHSIPPHLVAKAARTLGEDAFRCVDEALMRAYFSENRDITDVATLRAIWRDAGLPEDAFLRATDPTLLERVVAEHNEAIEYGVTGVPAVRMEGRDGLVVGAQPYETYRTWIGRALAGEGG